MDWISVQSTNISRVRWDEQTMALEVEFVGGKIYQYFDVPQPVYEGLIRARESHGRYFNENIKGHYRYAKQ